MFSLVFVTLLSDWPKTFRLHFQSIRYKDFNEPIVGLLVDLTCIVICSVLFVSVVFLARILRYLFKFAVSFFFFFFQGLKANMKRLYQLIAEQQFSRCHKQDKYKKMLFALCFFHSMLLERRKFLMLGWNIQYGFSDSDFEVSENLLSIYLDEYEETPWDALKYLVKQTF